MDEASSNNEVRHKEKIVDPHAPHARKDKSTYHRMFRVESHGTIERQRKEAREELSKVGILEVVDERKKYLRDHEGDISAALDVGILHEKGEDIYVACLRWDMEELKKDVYISKAVRAIFHPAQNLASVSYLAKNEDGKLEWIDFDENLQLSNTVSGVFTAVDLDDTIMEAIALANGKTFDNRKMIGGKLSSQPPGIGKL